MDKLLERLRPRWNTPFPVCLDINQGWVPLVNDLVDDLEKIDPNFNVSQVKEKFGTLRFYAGCSSDAVSTQFFQRIGKAEKQSGEICSWCGEPGVECYVDWTFVLCRTHFDELVASRTKQNAEYAEASGRAPYPVKAEYDCGWKEGED